MHYVVEKIEDASKFRELKIALATETDNMMLEVDEVPSVSVLESRLNYLSMPENGILFGAYVDDNLVGFITLDRGKLKRNSGIGSLVMGVKKDFNGKGVGYSLMSMAIDWSKKHGIYRLTFDVRVDNERAVFLYKKLGFKIEGTIRRGAYIAGTYVDKYLMAMLL